MSKHIKVITHKIEKNNHRHPITHWFHGLGQGWPETQFFEWFFIFENSVYPITWCNSFFWAGLSWFFVVNPTHVLPNWIKPPWIHVKAKKILSFNHLQMMILTLSHNFSIDNTPAPNNMLFHSFQIHQLHVNQITWKNSLVSLWNKWYP